MTIIGSDKYVHRFELGHGQTDSFVFDLNTDYPYIIGFYTEGTPTYTKANLTLRANKTFVDNVHLYFLKYNNGIGETFPFKPVFDRHSGKLFVERNFAVTDLQNYYLYVLLSKQKPKEQYIYKGVYLSVAPDRTGIMDLDIDLDQDVKKITGFSFYFDRIVDLSLIVDGKQMYDRQPLGFYSTFMGYKFLVPCNLENFSKLQVRLNTILSGYEKHINVAFQVPIENKTIPDKKIFIDKKINDERFLVK